MKTENKIGRGAERPRLSNVVVKVKPIGGDNPKKVKKVKLTFSADPADIKPFTIVLVMYNPNYQIAVNVQPSRSGNTYTYVAPNNGDFGELPFSTPMGPGRHSIISSNAWSPPYTDVPTSVENDI